MPIPVKSPASKTSNLITFTGVFGSPLNLIADMPQNSPQHHIADYLKSSGQIFHLVMDPEGRLFSCNPLFEQKAIQTTVFPGMPVAELFLESEKDKFYQAVLESIQRPGTVIAVEIPIQLPVGSKLNICWEFSFTPDALNPPGIVQATGIVNEHRPKGIETQTLLFRSPGIQLEENHLQQSELFYRNLFANSLDGVLITDEKGVISFASDSVTPILGHTVDNLVGTNAFAYTHPEDREFAISAFMDEVIEKPRQKFISIRLLKKEGGSIWCIIRGHNLMQNPYVKGMVIYFYDDTLRKKAEDALTESEKRFRSMIYNLSQGVLLLNEKAEVVLFNRAAQTILGIGENELFGRRLLDREWNVLSEEGQVMPAQYYPVQIAIDTKKQVRDVLLGVYRQSREDRVWVIVSVDPVLDQDGNIINIIVSFTDITEQKRLTQELMEQEIQKQRLLVQATIDGQEKERLEIGKELHDNISQHLTTTKLYLEVGKEKASDEVLDMISLAHKSLSDIIFELRQLSQSLVPPTLGDLGMVESITDLCDALKRTHTFQVEFYHRHFSEERLPDNLKLMLFRIIQEQINNIIRHASADIIQIKLQSDAENILLIIADNGRGFDLSDYRKGLGLTNITNRAELFNGKVEINAAPGQGCSLYVAVPIPLIVSELQKDELL